MLAVALAIALQSVSYWNETSVPADDALSERLRAGLATVLRDAPSAQFRVYRGVRRGEFTSRVPNQTYTGDVLCVQINAKNGFGSYTGFDDFVVVVPDTGPAVAIQRIARGVPNADAVRQECLLPAD